MQKLGLLALALSASVLADTAEKPAGTERSMVSSLQAAAVSSDRSGEDIRDIELGKRVYFYKYLTENYMAALTAPVSEPSLAETEVLMTLPVSFLNMGMDHYALSMINDPVLQQRGGLGNSWFVLAQRASEQGDWDQAYDFASRAMESDALLAPGSLQENRYMLVSSLAGSDQINSAKSILDEMSDADRWYFYAMYNVMLAEMRTDIESDALAKILKPILKIDSVAGYDEALRDRFLLTAGRYELERKNYPAAVDYLRMVSSDGPYAAPALLQYGWALSRQWLYDQALQPWRILQDNFYRLDLNVLESLMATPYVAELMNGGIESLNVYEYAERQLTSALYDIDRLRDRDMLENWVRGWSENEGNSHENFQNNWLESKSELVDASEVSRALESLLDTSEFATAQQQLLDIRSIQSWLEQQKSQVTEQAQRLEAVTPVDGNQSNEFRLQLAEVKAVQARTKRWIETEEVAPYPYATEQEMVVLRQLDSIRQETEDARSDDVEPNYDVLHRRADTLLGVQAWNVSKKVPVRRWESVKSYLELGQQVNSISEQLSGVIQLEKQFAVHHIHIDSRKQRLDDMIKRLDVFQDELDQLRHRQQNHVVTLAEEHLNMLDSRLKEYLATTRLSIARLYDNELRRNTDSGGLGDYE